MLIYEQAVPADEDAITRLYETYLNSGASIRGYVRAGLENPDTVSIKCTDTETGQLAGIIASRPGLEFTYPHPELENEIKELWGAHGIYSSDVMIVDPAYRGQGVAKELTLRLREGLITKRARCIVMELWIRPDGVIPALHPVHYLGEPTILKISNDFYKDLGKYGLSCPECGVECHCGAMIAVIDFQMPWKRKSVNDEGTA